MKTESELFQEREAAQQNIHQTMLRSFIACAEAGYTAKDLLAYLKNALEGMNVCAAFNLEGQNLAYSLRLELDENASDHVPVYLVKADRETGEWIGEPQNTGETSSLSDWHKKTDTAACHYDTYEHGHGQETRAIILEWA